ncbi:class I SAM-dependent methyltransferase [Altericista sp. CCNU0014]|uniref:class I SAM-dependent methyltransferase n=1 Tax=Altericista sp. CCNU0014 TaxID=3082949 RepID=UPI003850F78E
MTQPPPMSESSTQSAAIAEDRPLRRRIASRIAESPQQRVTFAAFMDWALYEPALGYYAAQRQKIGAGGDFVTSPHLGADFGELLAEQFLDLWLSLGRPIPFHVVEMGAGQGLIAADVLNYLRESSRQSPASDCAAFWEALQYVIIEKATAFIAEQRYSLKSFEADRKLTWKTWPEIPDRSITGCFFSNELVDAFPVHRIEIQAGQVREIYVAIADPASDSIRFAEVVAPPSTPALQKYLEMLDLDLASYPNGYRSEINLAALDWLKTVAQKLACGYILTIDYGYTAAQYYSPQRSQGTLQCYYQQAHHEDPYWAVGQQDITAHVNFTALERQGENLGLQNIARVQQGLFLMALGLGDRLDRNAASAVNFMEILRRREALHALANPLGLGGFGVLLQGTAKTPCLDRYAFKGFKKF